MIKFFAKVLIAVLTRIAHISVMVIENGETREVRVCRCVKSKESIEEIVGQIGTTLYRHL